jgi:hypothetical protein
MLPEQINYPAAYYDGHACFYERALAPSSSRIGGPSDIQFSGIVHGPRSLHHILTLGSDELPGIQQKEFTGLSLFYGMCFDGCSMSYEVRDAIRYHLLELEPTESSDGWPYSDYPDLLPTVPLRLARRIPCSRERFSEFLAQKDKIEADELVVVVPPISDLGMSLWGDNGDAEGVQIIFRCDLQTRRVRVYNECT